MDFGILIGRLVIGLTMAAHGSQKLFGWFNGYGIAGTGGFFEAIGFRPGRLFAFAAGFAEFAGGLLTAFGLLGPIGPALIISVMVVAMLAVHAEKGFFVTSGGIEVTLVYVAVAVILASVGPGVFSLDGVLGLPIVWTLTLTWTVIGVAFAGALASLGVRRRVAA